jgi:hypothetical protein
MVRRPRQLHLNTAILIVWPCLFARVPLLREGHRRTPISNERSSLFPAYRALQWSDALEQLAAGRAGLFFNPRDSSPNSGISIDISNVHIYMHTAMHDSRF